MDPARLDALRDDEFEAVVADLLHSIDGHRYERFARGRDDGIDLRHVDGDGRVHVVQCKHYPRSRFSHLVGSLRNTTQHLQRTGPSSYRLVTSLDLTPRNKDELVRLLSPWLKGGAAIWGRSEVVDLLRSYPEVVRRHRALSAPALQDVDEVVRVRLARDVAPWLARVTDALVRATGAPAPPAYDYPAAMEPLLAHYREVFVGRDEELERLSQVGSSDERVLLVTGNTGSGKSALVANYLAAHGRRGLTIFFLVRLDAGETAAIDFLLAANCQLMRALGIAGEIGHDVQTERMRFRQLWRHAAEEFAERGGLLMIVDGLDEQPRSEPVPIASLLPDEFPPGVGVVATSRPRPDHRRGLPPHHPLRRASILELRPLTRGAIAAVLRHFGARDDEATVAEVTRITRGEPLFVRYMCADIAAGGDDTLRRLKDALPGNVNAYFQSQFDYLVDGARASLTWNVLAALAAAEGPIAPEDLASLLEEPLRDVRRVIPDIERYLIGHDRLMLNHAEMRQHVKAYIGDKEWASTRERFAAWCESFASARWPDDTPDYVLESCLRHWQAVRPHERVVAHAIAGPRIRLVTERRQSTELLFEQFGSLERQLQRAQQSTPEEFAVRYAVARLRGATADIQPEALGALARDGRVDDAIGAANLLPSDERRALALALIARELVLLDESVTRDEVATILEQALDRAQHLSEAQRSSILAVAAEVFSAWGQADQIESILTKLRGSQRSRVLPALIACHIRAGARGAAMAVAAGIRDDGAALPLAAERLADMYARYPEESRCVLTAWAAEPARVPASAVPSVAVALARVGLASDLEGFVRSSDFSREASALAELSLQLHYAAVDDQARVFAIEALHALPTTSRSPALPYVIAALGLSGIELKADGLVREAKASLSSLDIDTFTRRMEERGWIEAVVAGVGSRDRTPPTGVAVHRLPPHDALIDRARDVALARLKAAVGDSPPTIDIPLSAERAGSVDPIFHLRAWPADDLAEFDRLIKFEMGALFRAPTAAGPSDDRLIDGPHRGTSWATQLQRRRVREELARLAQRGELVAAREARERARHAFPPILDIVSAREFAELAFVELACGRPSVGIALVQRALRLPIDVATTATGVFAWLCDTAADAGLDGIGLQALKNMIAHGGEDVANCIRAGTIAEASLALGLAEQAHERMRHALVQVSDTHSWYLTLAIAPRAFVSLVGAMNLDALRCSWEEIDRWSFARSAR